MNQILSDPDIINAKQSHAIFNRWLIGLFTIIALVLVCCGIWIYDQQSQVIRQTNTDQLNSIAELKVGQIVQWEHERLGDALINSQDPFFRAAIEQWLKTPQDAALKTSILGSLQLVMKGYNYQNTLLANPEGRLLLSVDPQLHQTDSNIQMLSLEVIVTGQPQLGDFYRDSNTEQVHLDVAAPIMDENNKAVAVIILQIDPQRYLYPLIQSWPTASQSAETLLVQRDGADVLYLNTLRHSSVPPLTLRIPLSNANTPAVQAVLGKTGEFEGLDYRGVNVLSEIYPVPGTPWLMVAKIDRDEAFAGVQTLGLEVLLFVLLAGLMTAAVAGSLYNNRRRLLYRDLLQAEQERRQAQEEIRTTLYSIGDGVITCDRGGCVTRLNPVAETLTGWSESEAQGLRLAQVFHIVNEQSRAEVENPVERVLQKGLVIGLANHTLLIARDGTERPIADSGAPIRDEQDNITGVVLVFRDQSQERAAQKERALLTDTLRSSLNEIYIFDAHTLRFRIVNDGALYNLGYTLEQVQGMTPLDIKPEFTPETFQQLINPLIEHQQPKLVFETVHRRANGSLYPVEVHLQLFEYPDEQVFLAVIQDITARKQAEQALRVSEEKFRKAFLTSPDAININSFGDGKYITANNGFSQIFGYSVEEVIGKTSIELNIWENSEDRKTWANSLNQNGEVINSETRFRAKNGEIHDCLTSASIFELDNLPHIISITRDITERKKTEEKLLFQATLLANISDVVYATDTQLRVTYLNQAAEKVYGYQEAEALGKPVLEVVQSRFDPELRKKLSLELTEKGSVIAEIEHQSKTGRTYFFESQTLTLRDSTGKITGYVSVNHDITERKQAAEALQTALARFQRMVDANIIGVIIAKADGSILEANDYYLEMLGYTQADLQAGKIDWIDITPAEYLPLDQICLQELNQRGTATPYEKQYFRRDGSRVWVLLNNTMLPGSEGEIAAFCLDISAQKALEYNLAQQRDNLGMLNEQLDQELIERKQAEQALIKSEALLIEMGRIGKIGAWEFNAETLETTWTEEVFRIHEVEPTYNPTVSDGIAFYAPASRPIIEKAVQRAIEYGEGYDEELEIITAKGNHRWVHTIGKAKQEQGKTKTVSGMFQDITESKRVKDEIRQLNASLEQRVQERTIQLELANKELEAFAYSVSHDLRAPLRAMDGFSAALLKDYTDRLDEQGRHYLERIQEASRRMGQLINDLLTLSRVTRTEFKRQQVDLSLLAREICAALQAQQPQRRVEFDIAHGLVVQGDAHLLRIALENLLNNAYKFSGQSEQAQIQVGVMEQAGESVYFVRDNGVGFDMDYAGKLFAPFQRLHSTQEFPGTGIGLVTVQRIVHRHGGRIWPEATLNQGATFYFTLGAE